MAPKRKANASIGYSDAAGESSNKRSKNSQPAPKAFTNGHERSPGTGNAEGSKFDHTRPEERSGIVQRKYYPAEMSNERCAQYNNNEIPRPIALLENAIKDTKAERDKIAVGRSVIHWYKRDLRTKDNKGLSLAAAKAREAKVPLICMFVVSPQDYEAHFTGSARVDFELRTLKVLQKDLAELDVPLYVETVEKRKDAPKRILELADEWGAKHLFCNIEYEVDELRRETMLIRRGLEKGIAVCPVHDDVIVAPGSLQTGTGKQYAVYTPWYRSWVAHIHAHPELLDEHPRPSSNPPSARKKFPKLFDVPIPDAPANKRLEPNDQKRFEHLWPAGEHEALDRLQRFLAEKIRNYKDARNIPSANGTAVVSVHHSVGTLAARTSVRAARDANSSKKLDGGSEGAKTWISEVAWRDFYKHVLAHWPYICMFKPFKYEYTNVEWEYNDKHFKAWTEGKTGYPLVDAAMRQMKTTGYMHNRCRMVVASFLAKDLLLDWRLGEKHFMLGLVDADFASNNGGWGFSASTGVDPQPYFRIFNPITQSEKFDPEGDYIRKWVEELKHVKGKAIHDPYGRGAADTARKGGYPKMIVDHATCRKRALDRYKAGTGRETA
ncbi:photolyase [Pseudovirgaria hyperparasitica]|uniref:Photolyase n=1 Tax=Pseudovirgaria hyperparasitica TaxID=470096 RepID=A0A6A6VWT5_9PEZI|nr:photolyase [Pseudovirgaria hyperparasitica]KAF2755148.1 photolyase [Pseudovirgaria hyperparasitica]